MSRIRSIHPSLFTDESFMMASHLARLCIIGIWCEAFDDGVFPWKPITIKAKLFPADNIDINAILQELQDLNFIKKFESGQKEWGLVRNFCKFQRPKKPNSSGILPANLHEYVGLVPNSNDLNDDEFDTSSPPVPHQFPTSSEPVRKNENRWRMEDGGCNITPHTPQKPENGGGKPENPAPIVGESLKNQQVNGEKTEKQANDPPPKRRREYTPEFEQLWAGYPEKFGQSKSEAYDEWLKLGREDQSLQALALQSLPSFSAWWEDERKRKPDRTIVHVCRYLKQRRFESFAGAPPMQKTRSALEKLQ